MEHSEKKERLHTNSVCQKGRFSTKRVIKKRYSAPNEPIPSHKQSSSQAIHHNDSHFFDKYFVKAPFAYISLNSMSISELNDSAAKLFGSQRSQIINTDIRQFFLEIDIPRFENFCAALKTSSFEKSCEISLLVNSNVHVVKFELFDYNTTDDVFEFAITPLARAAFCKNENFLTCDHLTSVLNGINGVIFVFSPLWKITAVFGNFNKLFEQSFVNHNNLDLDELLFSENGTTFAHILSQTLEGKHVRTIFRLKNTMQPVEKWISIDTSPIIADGLPAGVCAICLDLTNEKVFTEKYIASERFYRNVSQTLSDYIYRARLFENELLTFEHVLGAFEQTLTYSLEEIQALPHKFLSIVHPSDIENVHEFWRKIATNNLAEVQYRIFTKNGETRWLHDSATPVFDEKTGKFDYIAGSVQNMSQLHATVELLQKSEQRFTQLADTIDEVFWLRTKDQILYINRAFEKIFELSRENIFENPQIFLDRVLPEDFALNNLALDTFTKGENIECRYRIDCGNGRLKWIESKTFPIKNATGEVIREAGLAQDITDKVLAAEKIAAQHNLIRALAESTNLDDALRICLDAALDTMNLDAGGIYIADEETGYLHLRCQRNIPPTFIEKIAKVPLEAKQVIETIDCSADIAYNMPLDSEFAPFAQMAVTAVFHDGKLVGIINVPAGKNDVIDDNSLRTLKTIATQLGGVIARLKTEEKWRKSFEQNRALLEAIPDAVMIFDGDGNFYSYKPDNSAKSPFPLNDVLGKNITAAFPPYTALKTKKMITQALDTGKIQQFEYNIAVGEIGNLFRYECRMAKCGTNRVLAVVRDITEHRRAEDLLKMERTQLFTIFDSIDAMIYVADPVTYEILFVNKYMRSFLSTFSDGKKCYEALHGLDEPCPFCTNDILFMLGDEAYRWEYSNRLTRRDLLLFDRLIRWTDGRLVRFELGIDITEIKNTEQENARLNFELNLKNNELEQLVYSASHDLRSPLIAIQDASQALETDATKILTALREFELPERFFETVSVACEEEIPNNIRYILNNVRKMDALLSGILKLLRIGRENLALRNVDVQKLLNELLETFRTKARPANVAIEVGFLPDCVADELLLRQVFFQLLDNAIKFRDNRKHSHISIHGKQSDGFVTYFVEDNGIGIVKSLHNKIFDVFYRIDGQNSTGEGLGLSVARRIVEKHRGTINVESEPGVGSTFFFKIPN